MVAMVAMVAEGIPDNLMLLMSARLACGGAEVWAEDSAKLVELWRQHPLGTVATIISQFEHNTAGTKVILETALGGRRLLNELEDEPLPRIC